MILKSDCCFSLVQHDAQMMTTMLLVPKSVPKENKDEAAAVLLWGSSDVLREGKGKEEGKEEEDAAAGVEMPNQVAAPMNVNGAFATAVDDEVKTAGTMSLDDSADDGDDGEAGRAPFEPNITAGRCVTLWYEQWSIKKQDEQDRCNETDGPEER